MKPQKVPEIATFCYQFTCEGNPICLPLKTLLPAEDTFVTLSKYPESFIALLSHILLSYETEIKCT
jgi:hypothetical protein